MRPFKQYSVHLIAVFSIIFIGAYEFYWLSGLYGTRKDAVDSQIKLAISLAEIDTWVETGRNGGNSVSYVGNSKILALSAAEVDSVFLPRSVTVTKVDDAARLKGIFSLPDTVDIESVDRAFSGRMDSLGLSAAHSLRFVSAEGVASVSSAGYEPSDKDYRMDCLSMISGGTYEYRTRSLHAIILRGMSGVLLVSVGILLLLVLAFVLIIRVLHKQRKLDEMKMDFAGNMTHELKTPIAVAYAANDAMLELNLDTDEEKRLKYLRATRSALERLSGMVEQVLSMTVGDRDAFRPKLGMTELKPLIDSAVEQAKLGSSKPCSFAVSVEPENLCANIDAMQMQNVFSTLIDNAVKYSEDEASVEISAFMKNGKVCISVSDKGIGISEEDQKHIFDKFYRVPSGDVHNVKGYGIGLFFSRTMVERHGGRISVKSRPGAGSTFLIEL